MSAPPTVALLTREYPPEVYGGAGVHVEHLAGALADHVDVAVHCFGAPRDDPLVAGAYRPWGELAGDEPERAALRAISVDLAMVTGVAGADLLHSHTWYANLAGHLGKLVHDVPHVVTCHSLEPLRPWKREQLGGGYELSRFCERTAIENADAVVAVSEGMRHDVLGAYPAVEPERVVVVHNGIDADVYRPDHETDVLDGYGIDPHRPIVVYLGRIARQKGITHLLDAATHLGAGAQVVLLAGAPDTPELAAEVAARVERLREVRDDVIWIDRMLERREVVQILTHATVSVCPSVYEPFGLVNLEAMACGTAVVATAVGGVPEVVVDGETGYLVRFETADDDHGNPADPGRLARDLAGRIDALLADRALAERFGAAGRRRVLERFAWTAVAARTADLYRDVIGASP